MYILTPTNTINTALWTAVVASTLLLSTNAAAAKRIAPLQNQAAQSDNALSLGLSAGVAPRYSGAQQMRPVAGPVIDYAMSNGFFASTTRGIGYGSNIGTFSYSAALGYRIGRKDEDGKFGSSGSDYLKGMGSIKGAATLTLQSSLSLTDWLVASAGLETPLTARDTGSRVLLNLSAIAYQGSDDTLTASLGTNFADSKYMRTWYGVSAAQAANTKFAEYKPKSGFYEVSATVNWDHAINKQWHLKTIVGASHLTGDAGKSPIVQRKLAPVGMIQVTYLY